MTIPPSPLAVCRILKDGASFAKRDREERHPRGAVSYRAAPGDRQVAPHVRLEVVSGSSADPRDKPRILFNYLQHEDDRADWRACIRLTREIIAQPAFDGYRGPEIQPREDVRSDEAIDTWVRANAESAYHPSCTCKIGGDDDVMAVLDSECRVRGIDHLRVVDSSVFPTITNGNLNAPTTMVAERAADLIKGVEPLPPSNAPFYIDQHWQSRQRPGTPVRPINH
jgi:choline dehydrogenase